MAEETVAESHIKTGKVELKKISPQELQERIAKKNAAPIVETAPAEQKPPTEKSPSPIAESKPVEDKAIEAKPEEPKAEGEKSAEEQAKPKLKDKLKPFSAKKQTPAPEGEVVVPEPVKAQLSDYEKKLAEKESILSDPEVKAFLEARKAGKSVIDIFKEAIGNQIDTTKMTDAQVYEHGLKANGVKPASELEEDSEETSLEDEMEKFKAMGRIAQKREADTIRKEIESKNTGTTDNFLNKLISHNQTAEAKFNEQKQKDAENILSLSKGISEWADAYSKGGEHYTVVGDPKLAESIKNFNLADLIFPTKEDGSLDVEKVADLIHYSLTKDLRYENLENQFFSKGFDELKKDVEVTKGATQGLSRAPQGSKPKSEQEIAQEAHAKMRPVSVGHASVYR